MFQIQPSHLHSSQEEEKSGEKPGILGVRAFLLTNRRQNEDTSPHVVAGRETVLCGHYFRRSSVQLKTQGSLT